MRIGIGIEHFDHIQMGRSVNRIAPNPDTCGLANSTASELPHRLIGQRAAARHYADIASLMYVTGRNANPAAAGGILAFARSHNPRAIWSDQPRRSPLQRALNFYHIIHWNPFRNATDKFQTGIRASKNSICRKRWRDEDCGCGRAGLFHGFGNRVENRNFILKKLTAFAWRDSRDDLRAVSEAQLRVPRAKAASDALDEDFSFWSYEDRHLFSDRLYHLLCRIGHRSSTCNRKPRFRQGLLARFDIVSLQPHH